MKTLNPLNRLSWQTAWLMSAIAGVCFAELSSFAAEPSATLRSDAAASDSSGAKKSKVTLDYEALFKYTGATDDLNNGDGKLSGYPSRSMLRMVIRRDGEIPIVVDTKLNGEAILHDGNTVDNRPLRQILERAMVIAKKDFGGDKEIFAGIGIDEVYSGVSSETGGARDVGPIRPMQDLIGRADPALQLAIGMNLSTKTRIDLVFFDPNQNDPIDPDADRKLSDIMKVDPSDVDNTGSFMAKIRQELGAGLTGVMSYGYVRHGTLSGDNEHVMAVAVQYATQIKSWAVDALAQYIGAYSGELVNTWLAEVRARSGNGSGPVCVYLRAERTDREVTGSDHGTFTAIAGGKYLHETGNWAFEAGPSLAFVDRKDSPAELQALFTVGGSYKSGNLSTPLTE